MHFQSCWKLCRLSEETRAQSCGCGGFSVAFFRREQELAIGARVDCLNFIHLNSLGLRFGDLVLEAKWSVEVPFFLAAISFLISPEIDAISALGFGLDVMPHKSAISICCCCWGTKI